MQALTKCQGCTGIFLKGDEENLLGETILFCPACGMNSHGLDEVPDYFELAWYWEMIKAGFDTRELVKWKLWADRGMTKP